ncbi:MAG: YkvA family protein [Alphaproteobacteria bacterium]
MGHVSLTADTDQNGAPEREWLAEDMHLPVVMARNETYVRERFWMKLRRFVGKIPFSEDLVACYYCAMDRETPTRVRAVLLAALAYFVLPTDIIPDFIAGFGFTDDAAVLATAISVVGRHIKEHHRARARAVLLKT